jgi:hypothetical protein
MMSSTAEDGAADRSSLQRFRAGPSCREAQAGTQSGAAFARGSGRAILRWGRAGCHRSSGLGQFPQFGLHTSRPWDALLSG